MPKVDNIERVLTFLTYIVMFHETLAASCGWEREGEGEGENWNKSLSRRDARVCLIFSLGMILYIF